MKAVKVNTFADNIFVQLELQNLTESPLFVENVKLDPSSTYELVDLSMHNVGPAALHPLLKDEARRFCYKLVPKDASAFYRAPPPPMPTSQTTSSSNTPTPTSSQLPATPNRKESIAPGRALPPLPTTQQSNPPTPARSLPAPPTQQHSHPLGKIELTWRSTQGERGTLITNTIVHRGIAKPDVELVVLDTSSSQVVVAEQPFTLRCNLVNHSQNDMNIIIHLDGRKMYPISCIGSSKLEIGALAAQSQREVQIPLFPLRPGVHAIGLGISLHDSTSGQTYALSAEQALINVLSKQLL